MCVCVLGTSCIRTVCHGQKKCRLKETDSFLHVSGFVTPKSHVATLSRTVLRLQLWDLCIGETIAEPGDIMVSNNAII